MHASVLAQHLVLHVFVLHRQYARLRARWVNGCLGRAVSFAQPVVAPESAMMYLVATFIAAIRPLGERSWDA